MEAGRVAARGVRDRVVRGGSGRSGIRCAVACCIVGCVSRVCAGVGVEISCRRRRIGVCCWGVTDARRRLRRGRRRGNERARGCRRRGSAAIAAVRAIGDCSRHQRAARGVSFIFLLTSAGAFACTVRGTIGLCFDDTAIRGEKGASSRSSSRGRRRKGSLQRRCLDTAAAKGAHRRRRGLSCSKDGRDEAGGGAKEQTAPADSQQLISGH